MKKVHKFLRDTAYLILAMLVMTAIALAVAWVADKVLPSGSDDDKPCETAPLQVDFC